MRFDANAQLSLSCDLSLLFVQRMHTTNPTILLRARTCFVDFLIFHSNHSAPYLSVRFVRLSRSFAAHNWHSVSMSCARRSSTPQQTGMTLRVSVGTHRIRFQIERDRINISFIISSFLRTYVAVSNVIVCQNTPFSQPLY